MKKSSKTKIARVYATALYEAAVETKCLDVVKSDIVKLRSLLKENGDFSGYLSNPLWDEKDKEDVLKKSASVLRLHKETFRCLEIVTENRRVGDLALILNDFEALCREKEDIAEVNVETVKKLSASQDAVLKRTLEKIFAKKIIVNYLINPSIMGGLRVQCGSKMYDDSLSGKLNYLGNVMKGK